MSKNMLWAILGTILFALTSWGLIEVVNAKTDIASLQTNMSDIKAWMVRIDGKLDKLGN